MFCLYIIMCFLPEHRYSVVNFTFSGPLGLLDSTLLFGSRVAFNKGLSVALNPGLGGVRDVAPAIISHEACYFQTSDAVFPKDLFSDYFSFEDLPLSLTYAIWSV